MAFEIVPAAREALARHANVSPAVVAAFLACSPIRPGDCKAMRAAATELKIQLPPKLCHSHLRRLATPQGVAAQVKAVRPKSRRRRKAA